MNEVLARNKTFDWRNPPALLIPLLLLIALALAYSNSFHGPFVFDDLGSILENKSIQSLSESIRQISYGGATVSGRPILNFSLALNYASGGLAVEGYHLLNFLIHFFCALTLYGVFRRTLELSAFSDSTRSKGTWLAASITALWAMHPLQTESVTYIIQRAESLMSLFYLLTLYTFIRSQSSRNSKQWLLLSVSFCYCGMGTKEVMAGAPLVVLIYDKIFIQRNFSVLWKERQFYYIALFSSWILGAFLIAASSTRSGAIGFTGHISVWDYLQTQSCALCYYLRLIIWPDPLVFDYGVITITAFEKVIPCMFFILICCGGIGWLFLRKPIWSFWGVWGIILLAPTSSIIPIQSQTVVEHRVYLALAPLLFYFVLGSYRVSRKIIFPIIIFIIILYGFRTYQRNEDYKSAETLWKSTLLSAPLNPRAHNNYAGVLQGENKANEVKEHLQEAIRLAPSHSNAYFNLASLFKKNGNILDALQNYKKALEMDSSNFNAALEIGNIYIEQRDFKNAELMYRQCILIDSQNFAGYSNLAQLLELKGEWVESLSLGAIAVRLNPLLPAVRYRYAQALYHEGRLFEALEQMKEIVKQSPEDVNANIDLGSLYILNGNSHEAEAIYRKMIRDKSKNPKPYLCLGNILESQNRWQEAESIYLEGLECVSADPSLLESLKKIQEKLPNL